MGSLITVPLHNGIVSRHITPETCIKYNCFATGQPFEVVYLYTESTKYRRGGWSETDSKAKQVRWYGTRTLFGLHLWDDEPKPVYLCEGETDAMRLSQYLPYSYCLALGGNPHKDTLDTLRDTLLRFAGPNPITLCFDNDKEGLNYTRQFAKLLGGKVTRVLDLPSGIKDVCQLDPDVEPIFTSWPRLPPNMTRGTEVLRNIQFGEDGRIAIDYRSTGFPTLDAVIGGWSKGGMIMIAGHPKNGKSSFVNDLTRRYCLANPNDKVLVIPLEMTQEETLAFAGGADVQQVAERTYFVRHFGALSAEEMQDYLAMIPSLGITHVVIDHITAACTSATDGLQTKLLDSLLYTLQAAAGDYQVSMCVVTHVSMRGAEDGTISKVELRGSYGLAQVPLCVLGVQLQDAGLSRVYTITRHRYTGKSGSILLDYDETTRTYSEPSMGYI